jgi:hypothetical protein
MKAPSRDELFTAYRVLHWLAQKQPPTELGRENVEACWKLATMVATLAGPKAAA